MLCYIVRRRCRDGCKSDVDGKLIALLTSEIDDEPLFYGSNVLIRLPTPQVNCPTSSHQPSYMQVSQCDNTLFCKMQIGYLTVYFCLPTRTVICIPLDSIPHP